MRPRLRLFTMEAETEVLPQPQMTVRLGDLAEILSDAHANDRAWLKDFESDELQISADLFDVLCAYWHFRPSA